jgi:hypothetical protein
MRACTYGGEGGQAPRPDLISPTYSALPLRIRMP